MKLPFIATALVLGYAAAIVAQEDSQPSPSDKLLQLSQSSEETPELQSLVETPPIETAAIAVPELVGDVVGPVVNCIESNHFIAPCQSIQTPSHLTFECLHFSQQNSCDLVPSRLRHYSAVIRQFPPSNCGHVIPRCRPILGRIRAFGRCY